MVNDNSPTGHDFINGHALLPTLALVAPTIVGAQEHLHGGHYVAALMDIGVASVIVLMVAALCWILRRLAS